MVGRDNILTKMSILVFYVRHYASTSILGVMVAQPKTCHQMVGEYVCCAGGGMPPGHIQFFASCNL